MKLPFHESHTVLPSETLRMGRKLFGPGGLVLVLANLILIATRLPLGSAIEFVEDERYEVMKAFLCSKGLTLYTQIWNDQPPVHTMLLTWWFKMRGPTILSARLLAVGFGLLLFGAFYQLVKQRSSILCALLASFLLLCSPLVLTLSASVMLEVPAIGTALASALFLAAWRREPRWGWLAASGCIMGVALQIKLTAAVIGAAIAAEVLLETRRRAGSDWLRRAVIRMLQWVASAGVMFSIIGFLWGHGSLESSLKSHLTMLPHARFFGEGPHDFPIQLSLFWRHIECVLGAIAAVLWALRRRRLGEIAFPIVLLGTLVFIHGLHRPWWNYYYLHFAVPLAWLTGWMVAELLRMAMAWFGEKGFRMVSGRALKPLILCALPAAILARSEGRLEASVRQLQASPRTNRSALLATMRRYATGTHWVCAEDVMYPFHAQLRVPPELAVIMAKRYWSGQISAMEIIHVCEKYKPELVLLPNGRIGKAWHDFLHLDYDLVFTDPNFLLYVSRNRAK